ncbi:MAG: trigger factor [Rickettsiales bacterium]|jgi:trigger factor|nr:trigger factor [Rickettsiales bacterium]
MQITELESQGLKKKFKLVVDASVINQQTEAELKAAGEQVKIPGFRPGYIPMKVLQQRYGKAVQGDVLKSVINQTTGEALREKKIRPALTPQIMIEDYQDGGDLTFTMEVESFPDLPAITFDNITLDRPTFEISEAEIDEAAKRVAERSPEMKEAKEGAKAALGNILSIDFKGMIDGVAFDGGTASDFKLELGSKQFIDGFEDQLVGTKVGDDKIITVTFPENYPAEKLAGKEASFAVKVHAIYNKEVPEVNDEFAKARGFADKRAFCEAIRGQLIKEYDSVVRSQLKKALFDQLEEAYDFELPQTMVDMEFNSIWERLQQAKQSGDESFEGKSEDELKEEYRAIAERRVKLGIMLADIGQKNNVQISREELSRAVMQQASQFPGQEKQVVEFYQKNPDRIEDLRGPILEEKSVDLILSKVKFNDKKVTIDELMKESEEEGVVKKKPAKAKAPAKKKKS